MARDTVKPGFFESRSHAALLSIASNTTLIALKLVVGLITGSVSVISEAIHSSMDLLAAVIAYVSIRIAQRPADRNHPYGHGKTETLSAAIEALLIFAGAALIVFEASRRLLEGPVVEQVDLGIGVMALSAVVNYFVSRQLFHVARATHSAALEADAWHLRTDLYTAAGVGIGLLIVRLTGLTILDPLIAMSVAVLIVRAAWDITWRATRVLLDESLPARDQSRLQGILDAHAGLYTHVRMVRTRRGPSPHIEIALEFPPHVSLPEAHALTEHLEDEIRRAFPRAYAVVEAEPHGPASSPETIAERVRMVAGRLNAPVHHISVQGQPGQFQVNLHLEVPPTLSLGDAHAEASRVEHELAREIPEVKGVTTHIEPAGEEAPRSETAQADREVVLQAIEAIVPDLPEVRGVHDVEVRRQNGQIVVSMHCLLDGATPIVRAHWISSEIEARLKRQVPAISHTFVHTEPNADEAYKSGPEA